MIEDKKITHYDLCKKTAEWQQKKSDIVLFEYQAVILNEYPDVLAFNRAYTKLFEIKIDYQDFKKDSLKKCRVEKKIKYWYSVRNNVRNIPVGVFAKMVGMEEFYIENPHLGRERYYVCPSNLIQKNEIENGWGLYWWNGTRFLLKKESEKFKANIYDEMIILTHAFKKFGNLHNRDFDSLNNILIKEYDRKK